MYQTLFHIPHEVFGLPVFGAGILLALWLFFSAVWFAYLIWRQGMGADALGHLPLLLLVAAAIWQLLPALLDEEGLPIRGYGTMLVAAFAASFGMAAWRGRRAGFSTDILFSLAGWMFLLGVAGARLFYVIEYWESFRKATFGGTIWAVLNVAEGGLVVFGGFFGGMAALIYFTVRYRLPALNLLDVLAPAMMVGLAFGRVGCLLNGCCFGGVTDLPWAVTFPPGTPPYEWQVRRGMIPVQGIHFAGEPYEVAEVAAVVPDSPAARAGLAPGDRIVAVIDHSAEEPLLYPVRYTAEAERALVQLFRPGREVGLEVYDRSPVGWTVEDDLPRSLPIHPTQAYAVVNAILILLVLVAFEPLRRRGGESFALLITLYPISRIALEAIRTDEGAVFATGLTISQLVSVGLLCIAAAFWLYLLRQPPSRAGNGA